MLFEFLIENQKEVLAKTEKKTLDLAGTRPSSTQLKKGLPIFYQQLLEVLKIKAHRGNYPINKPAMAEAADEDNIPKLAEASGQPEEIAVAEAAGQHGLELLRLGYTLSHVVHAYGAMCQSITELATSENAHITPNEFHDLNRCLDIAIAGAVTTYQTQRNTEESSREVEHLGFLAHELRNTLTSINISVQMIKKGTVGISGSTGRVLEKGLKRMGELIDRSLTEVRLRVDPKVHAKVGNVLQLVDQVLLTAEIEAQEREQILEVNIDPDLILEADQQLFFSAVSNLIQNAIKYTRKGGKIEVRAKLLDSEVVLEVEDECGGLAAGAQKLFRPFEQQNDNRRGLGLGLTIAERAILLNGGKIEVVNLPSKGCIFKITLPQKVTA